MEENPGDITREDYHAWVMELKNGIKSIQWDLDELEESLGRHLSQQQQMHFICMSKRYNKYLLYNSHHLENGNHTARLDSTEFEKRRNFIAQTREEVKSMSEKITKSNSKPKGNFDGIVAASTGPNQNGTKYMRLINAPDASNQGENILFKAPFDADDSEQKSPYVPDHSMWVYSELSILNFTKISTFSVCSTRPIIRWTLSTRGLVALSASRRPYTSPQVRLSFYDNHQFLIKI